MLLVSTARRLLAVLVIGLACSPTTGPGQSLGSAGTAAARGGGGTNPDGAGGAQPGGAGGQLLGSGGANPSSAAGASLGGSGGGVLDAAGMGSTGMGFAGAGDGGGQLQPGGSSAGGGGAAGSVSSAGDGVGGVAAGGSAGNANAPQVAVVASALVPDMGFGTNIGNTLENTTEWETGWGQPLITEAFINGIASRGIKTVRVPVAWDTYATGGVIDITKLARVKEVVGWIEAAGMYSLVNIHWDGGWLFNESNTNAYRLTDDVRAKFASYWEQIATGFEDVGHRLILEGLNEEARFFVDGNSSGTPDYAALNEINQLFVTTVRAQGGFNSTRALLIAGFHTDIDLTCVDSFVVPTDPAGAGSLFLSLHYYTPFTFCGLDTVESWGSPATTWGTDAERATLEGLFDKLAAFSSARQIPVVLGEFAVTPGATHVRDPASRILWMESVTQASLMRNIVPVLWDTGSEISRIDGAFSAELQAVMESLN